MVYRCRGGDAGGECMAAAECWCEVTILTDVL
jgi:hypothetical protein